MDLNTYTYIQLKTKTNQNRRGAYLQALGSVLSSISMDGGGGTVLDISDGATLALMLASAATAGACGPIVSLEVRCCGVD